MGLLGVWVASRPIDGNHPYGHKKYETMASIGISVLLFIACFNIVKEGVLRFLHPIAPVVSLYSFVVIGVTLAVNAWVMMYETRKGKTLKSDVLVSDAMHTRADILTSSAVIGAFFSVKLGYPEADSIISLVIAVFIGYAAVEILRESSRVLSDGAAIPGTEIERMVLSIPGVRECHRIRSRGRSDDIHVDLHILVHPEMHVDLAHELSSLIETRMKREFSGVTDVVVHIEPTARENGKRQV